MQSQGKRSKVHMKSHASLEGIFSDLSMAFSKGNVGPSSVVAADLVSVGDSWLNYAISKAVIEPIQGVEDQDWFKGLNDRWKVRKQLLFHVLLILDSEKLCSFGSLYYTLSNALLCSFLAMPFKVYML